MVVFGVKIPVADNHYVVFGNGIFEIVAEVFRQMG
jgi:hypothetical protein